MHARSCQTNGDFTLISLAHRAQLHLPPHLSLLPPSYSLPPYRQSLHAATLCLLLSLHPSIAHPAPAVHLFILCDVTQNNNVSLFGAAHYDHIKLHETEQVIMTMR